MRVIGDNSDGFANEKEIRDSLNSKIFDKINPNLKNFLRDAFKGYDLSGKWVHAHVMTQRVKPDFYVTIDGIPKGIYVSVKKGSGNSIHQENLDKFLNFLKTENIDETTIDYFTRYHFADGTNDNSGLTRYTSKEYSSFHSNEISIINKAFSNKNFIKKCIYRFLLRGNYENAPEADYLYHGDKHSGVWASKEEIINYILSKSIPHKSVNIGPFSYQVWNSNIKRNPKTENRRLVSQIKWGSMTSCLLDIASRRKDYNLSGKYEGDMSEVASVMLFNREPSSPIFAEYLNSINKKPEDVLLIRVTTHQYSKLSEQKVNTRADAYAIEIIDNKIYDLLEENDFYLDEDKLIGYDNYYKKIEYSGISIKKNESKGYTLLKLTPNSFEKIFGNYEMGYAASIFCKKPEELHYNIPLLDGWHTNIESLQKYFHTLNITVESLISDVELCKNIKNAAVDDIKNIIDNNNKIKEIIFNGKYIYDEPYSAEYFLQDNKIRELDFIDYNISTGSGRSHGDYSIVLKPKNSRASI